MNRAAVGSALFFVLVAASARGQELPRYAPTPQALATAYERPEPPPPRVSKDRIEPHWLAGDRGFWYRNDLPNGGKEFVHVTTATGKRRPAFDHGRLAAGLSTAADAKYAADRLPFDTFTFADEDREVRFKVGKVWWACRLDSYQCSRVDAPAAAPEPAPAPRRPRRSERSPDGKWSAIVRDGNLFVRDRDGKETRLTADGQASAGYVQPTWSPDSKTLAAFRYEPGENKEVYRLESSAKGGSRAVLHHNVYPLPGDKLARYTLSLFDAETGTAKKVDAEPVDFGTPEPRWAAGGQTLTYEKVDRGHQRFRLIEVNARTGASRSLIDERSPTFLWTNHGEYRGVPLVTRLSASNEYLYASEKSGWRHLYLVNGATGQQANAITQGEWVVRGIDRVDEAKRQVWFRASGFYPGQDPYFVHYFRINLDGTGLTPLTAGDGTHGVQASPHGQYLIDTYSRADRPPVHELRRAADGGLVCPLETAQVAVAKTPGWSAPEIFTAKGRDGTTDIWGLIHRPAEFDPLKRYPVIESIYAGPHGAFVPKAFSSTLRFRHLTDLGFVVVQIDGMGTAHRSKAFHDVCWHNLKDAGFPDRILWHKAAAARYPWYDATRVGIYGTSAGGQNAAGALLFHGDFYKAAVAACGCHDNRMDKASWNEQWMGYPVGPHYAACSNIDNAHRLRGKLLLVVGELDSNVPPESTYRFADALIKAGKDFDFLLVPGAGHSDGGAYGRRRRQDFFVRHLHGVEPPNHNASGPAPSASGGR